MLPVVHKQNIFTNYIWNHLIFLMYTGHVYGLFPIDA